jgi:hypothetical protein
VENGVYETEGNKAGNMTVEMALFFVLEEHPLPTCFETTSEMFHDLKNVCLYNTAYVFFESVCQ